MSENSKVTASHRQRAAIVYVRQSTLLQQMRNKESTARQYDLVQRAVALGWSGTQVSVVDEDQGISGASAAGRSGFADLAAQVGLGQVGIILALEVSRLARNNADWYRLLDLAAMTDTLVADADGVCHPRRFDDRLVLGMKGTMAEAELHILRARLDGGVRNKAARGELRRGLPVGLVWGEADGEILFHPDEAVVGVIRAVFERFTECGSARAVWLWLREQGLKWPLQPTGYVNGTEIVWVEPTYHAVHNTLTHPAYAGAYVYGRTRFERRLGKDGQVRNHRRVLPRDQWQVLIEDHHEGFITWEEYLANQDKIASNTRPRRHEPGTGAVREGCALLQGLAVCGTCGRKLAVFYQGPAKATPGYYCTGSGQLVDGRGTRHLHIGGQAIDAAVATAFLAALTPAALDACLKAADQLEASHDAALAQHRREVERARYDATRAERRYRAVDPDNRLVARGLEADWEKALTALAAAEAELSRRERRRPTALTAAEHATVLALADDLGAVWSAETTTDKDRKQLLHTLIEDVTLNLHRDAPDPRAEVLMRWKGGATSHLVVPIRRPQPKIRTSEDTIDLIRRLAVHYPDAQIAGILNRQGRRTARGLSYTASRVQSLRHHWNIPCHTKSDKPQEGELVTVAQAAAELGLAPSTLHRWLGDGFIAGEQDTPGAPWRIRLNDDLRNLFVDTAPDGWLATLEATLAYGVSRQTLLQRVKRGELKAVHVRTGRRKGLRIEPPTPQNSLF
ncbi:recombinase family protein [Streptomyces canus]|uniref:recombinase family protein n=1 Tax=Streptomyces canus TaxID=58343 RepID=UPI002258C506|nr:recombinase family protein [Streptomyces canus]MCX4859659.1 recombinase family protein [Streptomyces canus]